MVIGVPQLTKTLPTLSVTLMGKDIQPVTTSKDLGVYIDNSLNYNDHINKIGNSYTVNVLSIVYGYYPAERTTRLFNYYILLGKIYIFVQRFELKTLSLSQFLDFFKNEIIVQRAISQSKVLFSMETVPFSVRKFTGRIDVIK